MELILEFLKTNSSEIVALSALALTIYQGFVQRAHYRTSVRPVAEITYRNLANEISVAIENKGIGPLLITDFKVVKANQEFNDLNELVRDSIPKDAGYKRKWVKYTKGKTISKESKLTIFSFERKEEHEDFDYVRDIIRDLFVDSELYVSYKDIYGKKRKPAHRKLVDFNKVKHPKRPKNNIILGH